MHHSSLLYTTLVYCYPKCQKHYHYLHHSQCLIPSIALDEYMWIFWRVRRRMPAPNPMWWNEMVSFWGYVCVFFCLWVKDSLQTYSLWKISWFYFDSVIVHCHNKLLANIMMCVLPSNEEWAPPQVILTYRCQHSTIGLIVSPNVYVPHILRFADK